MYRCLINSSVIKINPFEFHSPPDKNLKLFDLFYFESQISDDGYKVCQFYGFVFSSDHFSK